MAPADCRLGVQSCRRTAVVALARVDPDRRKAGRIGAPDLVRPLAMTVFDPYLWRLAGRIENGAVYIEVPTVVATANAAIGDDSKFEKYRDVCTVGVTTRVALARLGRRPNLLRVTELALEDLRVQTRA